MQPSNPYEYRAPHLVSQTHYCVMGDVTVADGVMIAPGVVLQAASGSRIVIEAGACLAGGVCIQSRGGVLKIGAGANLGANVLVVGQGEVGDGACISPGSTLMDPSVSANALLPPGSLVSALVSASSSAQPNQPSSQSSHQSSGQRFSHQSGQKFGYYSAKMSGQVSGFASGSYVSDVSSFAANTYSQTHSTSAPVSSQTSNQAATQANVTNPHQNDTFVNTFVEPPPVGPRAIETPSLSDQNGQYVDPFAPPSEQLNHQSNTVQLNNNGSAQGTSGSDSVSSSQSSQDSALSRPGNQRVYGKDQVSQLISTLFPHRQA